jgi:hypothetical protein
VQFYIERISIIRTVGSSLLGDDPVLMDKHLWEEIELDTARTHRGVPFFGETALGTDFTVN